MCCDDSYRIIVVCSNFRHRLAYNWLRDHYFVNWYIYTQTTRCHPAGKCLGVTAWCLRLYHCISKWVNRNQAYLNDNYSWWTASQMYLFVLAESPDTDLNLFSSINLYAFFHNQAFPHDMWYCLIVGSSNKLWLTCSLTSKLPHCYKTLNFWEIKQ